MTLTVRPATVADLDAVAAVWLAGWQSTGLDGPSDPTVPELRARLDDELARRWTLTLAEADGAVVGMLATAGDRVQELFLAPERKGTGVGKTLFAEAKRLMPGGFVLWTQLANDRARAFYERQGMVLDWIGPRDDKPDQKVAHYRWMPA